jgi:hypothetical protein
MKKLDVPGLTGRSAKSVRTKHGGTRFLLCGLPCCDSGGLSNRSSKRRAWSCSSLYRLAWKARGCCMLAVRRATHLMTACSSLLSEARWTSSSWAASVDVWRCHHGCAVAAAAASALTQSLPIVFPALHAHLRCGSIGLCWSCTDILVFTMVSPSQV